MMRNSKQRDTETTTRGLVAKAVIAALATEIALFFCMFIGGFDFERNEGSFVGWVGVWSHCLAFYANSLTMFDGIYRWLVFFGIQLLVLTGLWVLVLKVTNRPRSGQVRDDDTRSV